MAELPACPDLEELAAWIDGRVDESTRQRLAAHLGDCDLCTELVDTELAFREELALDDDRADEAEPGSEGMAHHGVTPASRPRSTETDASAPSRRWLGAWAATLVLLVGVVGLNQLSQRLADRAQLEQALHDLRQNAPGQRADGLTAAELPVAISCRQHLSRDDKGHDPQLLVDCFELVSRDSDQASLLVAEAPAMTAWLASPDPVGAASCRVLEAAWGALTRTRQDEWRSHLEACRARGHGPQT